MLQEVKGQRVTGRQLLGELKLGTEMPEETETETMKQDAALERCQR